ncbi:MAG: xanthine dehydrogenase family protein molybdopterin-binding subunit [Pseudorhodoplanes sp.]|uniref:xanthine dehydrogenase family protein molybdopterin-binding subunit n=1 Tax=Pseudorhodoplanes sp. TaxID=1934341 RepID=UPI003D0F3BE9
MPGSAQRGIDRRAFLRLAAVGGVAIAIRPFHALAQAFSGDAGSQPVAGPVWQGAPGMARQRIEGFAKVSGAKIYAADFRARDMPGWPNETAHALLVKATDASHVFEGLDTDLLSVALRPDRVVMAADLAAAKITVPGFYKGDLLCPFGQTPLYLGQPLALLIWNDFARFFAARSAIAALTGFVKTGARTGPVAQEPYGSYHFVRVAGPTPESDDVYSALKAGWARPTRYIEDEPQWAAPAQSGSADAEATFYGDRIRAGFKAAGTDTLVLDRTFRTQSIDPVFLEPESALAWYDASRRNLEFVVGVQSPHWIATNVASLVANNEHDLAVKDIVAHCAYVGGGFGGRDYSIFPLYAAIAALFSPGRPVRLANNRYDQFQFGLKRHAFNIRSRIAVDKASGRMTAFASDQELDGGGLANLSAAVALVGAAATIGMYDVPKVDVMSVARHSRAVTAGSMRGFGAFQTMTALEVLIDETAATLALDPVEFRRRNILQDGRKTMLGNAVTGHVRCAEVLDRLAAKPLWANRAAEKARRAAASPDKLYGVGLSCLMMEYGSGSDPAYALVELDASGRISLASQAVEIGNGIATALAVRVADKLGRAADSVKLGDLDRWDVLGLVAPDDPFSITAEHQEEGAKNPRWVLDVGQDTTACNGAHVHTEAASEAANIILRYGLFPAALALWSARGAGASSVDVRLEDIRFADGKLVAPGRAPLALPDLAAKAHELGLVTAAMVHSYNRWSWATAVFDLPGGRYEGAIDALAVKYGKGAGADRKALMSTDGFHRLDRTSVSFPPVALERIDVGYAGAAGTIVALEIDKASGAVTILDGVTVLECGRAIVPELVEGQAEGGFAMGVGYALLENLPLYEDGPGNGQWNLDQYTIARASDLPVWSYTTEVLPPLAPADAPKGIAELVMCPVPAAILNAISDATGKRFATLPVTADTIKAAL